MENQNSNSNDNNPKQPTPALNDGHKNTLMAVLSYFGPLVIIPYLTAIEDSFVKFHIKQGLVLLIFNIIFWLLSKFILLQFAMLIVFLQILLTILAVIGIVNVLQGKEKNLPLIGTLSKHFTF